jgi:proliferating cell nuclear antigen
MEAETIKTFRVTLAEPKILKDSILIASELLQEVNLKVKPDSIELIAMDPANVAMVILRLFNSVFTEYNVEKEMTLGLNLGNLKQILRRANPSDILTMEFEESRIKIKLSGNTDRTFKLPIIELDEKEQKIPELSFPIKVTTNSGLLSEAIEDVSIVSESTTFTVDNTKLVISGEGDISNANIEIPRDENTRIIAANNKISSKYSVEYLQKMISGAKMSDEVILQFNKDYPLKIEFKEEGKYELGFILAPRVE